MAKYYLEVIISVRYLQTSKMGKVLKKYCKAYIQIQYMCNTNLLHLARLENLKVNPICIVKNKILLNIHSSTAYKYETSKITKYIDPG